MESGSEFENVPKEISNAAAAATAQLLPVKSKPRYENIYDMFTRWMDMKKCKTITEDVILAYLQQKSESVKSSTLWSIYSMLKSTILVKKNVNIATFPKVIAFLKRKNVGYKAKKSEVFSSEQINKFIREADNETYLMLKVATIFGLAGACRREELTKMSIDLVSDKEDMLLVKIPDSKTHIERNFVVIGQENLLLYRQYLSLRPSHTPHNRLFVNYKKRKCSIQPVGIHSFGNLGLKVAEFLNLPNPKTYTGHSMRRTSATIFADNGGNITNLKRHGGWKSTTVAEGYIDNSLTNKIKIAKTIQKLSDENNQHETETLPSCSDYTRHLNIPSISNKLNPFNISNCSNFNINININKN